MKAEGYLTATSDPYEVDIGRNVTGVRINLEPGLSIKGKVISRAQGKPIKGARVLAFETPDSAGKGGLPQPLLRRRPRSARSGSKGLFEITDIEPGTYEIVVSAKGYGTYRAKGYRVYKGRKSRELVIELSEGAGLEGIVSDYSQEDSGRLVVAAFGPERRPLFTGVDSKGFFSFTNLTPGDWYVWAFKDLSRRRVGSLVRKFLEGTIKPNARLTEGKTTRINIKKWVPLVGDLEGRLLKNGVPAVGFKVRLVEKEKNPGAREDIPLPPFFRRMEADVDVEGRFFLKGIDSGIYIIQGINKEREEWIDLADVQIITGETIRIDLNWPMGSISGRIFENGEPMAGVRVRAVKKAGAKNGGRRFFRLVWGRGKGTRTKTNGWFRIQDLKPGLYTIYVFPRRRNMLPLGEVQVSEQRETVRDFHLNTGKVIIRVTDSNTGNPVARAFVFAREPFGNGWRFLGGNRTDKNGHTVLSSLKEGEVKVSIIARGYERFEKTVTVIPGEKVELEARLKRSAKSKGR